MVFLYIVDARLTGRGYLRNSAADSDTTPHCCLKSTPAREGFWGLLFFLKFTAKLYSCRNSRELHLVTLASDMWGPTPSARQMDPQLTMVDGRLFSKYWGWGHIPWRSTAVHCWVAHHAPRGANCNRVAYCINSWSRWQRTRRCLARVGVCLYMVYGMKAFG